MAYTEWVDADRYKRILEKREKKWIAIFKKYEVLSAQESDCDESSVSSSRTANYSVYSEVSEESADVSNTIKYYFEHQQRTDPVCKPLIVENSSLRARTPAKTIDLQCEEPPTNGKSENVNACHDLLLRSIPKPSGKIVTHGEEKLDQDELSSAQEKPCLEAFSAGHESVKSQQSLTSKDVPECIISHQCKESSKNTVKTYDAESNSDKTTETYLSAKQVGIQTAEKGSEKSISKECKSGYVQSDKNYIGSNKPNQSPNRKQCLKSSSEFNLCSRTSKVVVNKLNTDISRSWSKRARTPAKTVDLQCEEPPTNGKSENVNACHDLLLRNILKPSGKIMTHGEEKLDQEEQSSAQEKPCLEAFSTGHESVKSQQSLTSKDVPECIISHQCKESSKDTVKTYGAESNSDKTTETYLSAKQVGIQTAEKGSEKSISKECKSGYVQSDKNYTGSNKPNQNANRKQCLKSSSEFNLCSRTLKVVVNKLNTDISHSWSNVILCQSDLDIIRNSQMKSDCYPDNDPVPAKRSLESCEHSLASICLSNGQVVEIGETSEKLKKSDSINKEKNIKDVCVLERKSGERKKSSESSVAKARPFFTSSDLKKPQKRKHTRKLAEEYGQLYSLSCLNMVPLKKRNVKRTGGKSHMHCQKASLLVNSSGGVHNIATSRKEVELFNNSNLKQISREYEVVPLEVSSREEIESDPNEMSERKVKDWIASIPNEIFEECCKDPRDENAVSLSDSEKSIGMCESGYASIREKTTAYKSISHDHSNQNQFATAATLLDGSFKKPNLMRTHLKEKKLESVYYKNPHSPQWEKKENVPGHADVSAKTTQTLYSKQINLDCTKLVSTGLCSNVNKSFEKDYESTFVYQEPSYEQVSTCKGNASISDLENRFTMSNQTDRNLGEDKWKYLNPLKETEALQPQNFRMEDCAKVENTNITLCPAFAKKKFDVRKKTLPENRRTDWMTCKNAKTQNLQH